MVDYTKDYKRLLGRAVKVYDGLLELYASGDEHNNEWAARSLLDTRTRRRATLEDLALPRQAVTAADVSPYVMATAHYLDSHWADFTTFPVPSPDNKEYPATDPAQRQHLLHLHAELEEVIKDLEVIYNALRQP